MKPFTKAGYTRNPRIYEYGKVPPITYSYTRISSVVKRDNIIDL